MLKVAIANGTSQADGSFTEPANLTSYAFIASDEKPQTAHIGGLEPGDNVAEGQFYAGEYNTKAGRFVGTLLKVSAFTAGGDPTPKNLTVTATSDGADVTASDSSASAESAAPASSASAEATSSAPAESSDASQSSAPANHL